MLRNALITGYVKSLKIFCVSDDCYLSPIHTALDPHFCLAHSAK